MLIEGGNREATVSQAVALTAGTPVTWLMTASSPATILATPGVDGSILVEYRLTVTGAWIEWPGSTVTVSTCYLLTGPVNALRLTATTSDGVVEIAQ